MSREKIKHILSVRLTISLFGHGFPGDHELQAYRRRHLGHVACRNEFAGFAIDPKGDDRVAEPIRNQQKVPVGSMAKFLGMAPCVG